MGNGSTADVGRLANPKKDERDLCGAMAEQRRQDGCDDNESAPQQFVHLIGFRDPDARRVQGTRPRPPSPKS
jgi:hypothetical protein